MSRWISASSAWAHRAAFRAGHNDEVRLLFTERRNRQVGIRAEWTEAQFVSGHLARPCVALGQK